MRPQWIVGSSSRASSSSTDKSIQWIPPPPITEQAMALSVLDGQRLYEWMLTRDIEDLAETMKAHILRPALEIGEQCQSKFTDYQDIEANGWTENPRKDMYDADYINLAQTFPVNTIVDDFKASSEIDENDGVVFRHDQTYFKGKEHVLVSEPG